MDSPGPASLKLGTETGRHGGAHLPDSEPVGSPMATYNFTDAELQSLLACLDQGRSDLPVLGACRGNGSGSGGDTGFNHLQGLSLQFQPHLPTTGSSDTIPPPPAVFVPSDLSGKQPVEQALAPHLPPLRHQQHAQLPDSSAYQQEPDTHPPLGSSYVTTHHPPPQYQRTTRSQALRPAGRGAAAARTHAAAPPPSAAAKQPHSIVEKQRRDRINHLIDELREIVPPQGGDPAAVQAEAITDLRRPKHVVLSDTIRLIKDLQLQVAELQMSPRSRGGGGGGGGGCSGTSGASGGGGIGGTGLLDMAGGWRQQQYDQEQEQEAADIAASMLEDCQPPPVPPAPLHAPHMPLPETQPQAQSPRHRQHQQHPQQAQHSQPEQPPASPAQQQQQLSPTRTGAGANNGVSGDGTSAAGSLGKHPALPHAPDDDASSASGVVVESLEGNVKYVKVTCPDRHGLLADVVRALRELPLEITTAAITTRKDHIVYDVFQVEVEDPSLAPERISSALEAVLRMPGDKKRRQHSWGNLAAAAQGYF